VGIFRLTHHHISGGAPRASQLASAQQSTPASRQGSTPSLDSSTPPADDEAVTIPGDDGNVHDRHVFFDEGVTEEPQPSVGESVADRTDFDSDVAVGASLADCANEAAGEEEEEEEEAGYAGSRRIGKIRAELQSAQRYFREASRDEGLDAALLLHTDSDCPVPGCASCAAGVELAHVGRGKNASGAMEASARASKLSKPHGAIVRPLYS